ncbi:aminotransferase class I/II-fold pyridoxal phosphate-dependent enzyme [Salinimicrobium tongyeongense]|uniref:Aminotransferase class I/II-fold pyridoxal phosphate-dependent enzyme n=1 Tax=Salinimicrobium tongyeongense TaxID=2809707 RepID=A0ABY6NRH0_9FLAO|nr:DegT/DnrJ/EryC1/StrS family aminotransferase [Salinimicrobium tongyeongense]UZH55497.1 aminotransferase class I/II-fold pyridoxal phosphate-dependent enzyme [Salinimicrobium tongyeongense]
MSEKKIWLSSPHMGGKEQNYISEAFEQNWIAPLGPNVNGFEKDLQSYLREENIHVAALSSGTASLHLALILAGVERGDEVLCQSLTFAASANPIVYQGATPVFIDSEEETLNISPVFLEEAIQDRISKGKKPKALIAVHLYGMPYKVDEVHEVALRYGIPVIEDSAEALGSSYKGQKCGTFGDFAILSFNGNKIITTSGGGALVTKSEELKQQAVFLATQARDEAPHYQHSQIGYNYRLSNIAAGIGRGQMEVLEEHISKRREMNQFYKGLFSTVEGVKVFSEPENTYFSNHWLTVIKSEENGVFKTEDLRLFLENENIESRPLWKPMHLQPVFRDAPFYGNGVAESAFKNGLCLPSGSNLSKEEKNRISDAILSFFKK